jgi:NAD(P)-dependent dehydrogenase (short-subunit alcohol dehydrogenase family)
MAPDPLFDVDGEVVVITGASGLRPSARIDALAARHGAALHFYCASVTNRAELQSAAQAATERFGTPTVLINNAALDSPPSAPPEENGPFETYPEQSWDDVIDVNLKGVYLCCQVFGAAMALAGRGSIINVSSIYGVVAPDQSLYEYRRRRGETFFKPVAYAASKSGVLNLTRYLAVYWARQGVRVNNLTLAGVFNQQEPEFLEAYCGRIPMGRMAEVEEYSGAMLFLASPASRYMTGSNLVVDGGWTAI